jgi:hypothetical protein
MIPELGLRQLAHEAEPSDRSQTYSLRSGAARALCRPSSASACPWRRARPRPAARLRASQRTGFSACRLPAGSHARPSPTVPALSVRPRCLDPRATAVCAAGPTGPMACRSHAVGIVRPVGADWTPDPGRTVGMPIAPQWSFFQPRCLEKWPPSHGPARPIGRASHAIATNVDQHGCEVPMRGGIRPPAAFGSKCALARGNRPHCGATGTLHNRNSPCRRRGLRGLFRSATVPACAPFGRRSGFQAGVPASVGRGWLAHG